MWTDFSEVRGEDDEGRKRRGIKRKQTSSHAPLPPPLSRQCMRETDDPRKCKERRDDYLECLHHRKEVREKERKGKEGFDVRARKKKMTLTAPAPPSFLSQFTRLNAIYREQKKQAAAAKEEGGGH